MGKTKKPNVILSTCNKCLAETRHDVIAERVQHESEEVQDNGITFDWETRFTMLECRGCGTVSARREVACADLGHRWVEHLPPAISRPLPRWRSDLPDEFSDLIIETYTALHADSRRLALMGARSLVDLFMIKTIGDIGGFKAKMKELVGKGYLANKHKPILDAALDAGHAATHRAHNPSKDDVNTVFDIVENLLQFLVLEEKTQGLKTRTPKREKKNSEGRE